MWHTHIIMYVHVLIIYNPPLSFREPCKNSQRKAFLEEVHFMSMKKQVFKLFAPFSSIQPPYGYPCKKQYEKTCGIPETNGEFVRKEAISKGKETCLCKKHQKTISWKCWDVDGWNPANHFTGTHYLQSFLFSDRDRCVGPPSTGCSFQRGKASPSMPLGSESMFDSHKAAPFHPRFQHAHKACFMNVPFITSHKKMLADSLPSFIMIFHHPFPEMRFFAKQKNVIPLIHPIPNQLYPTNPPDNTCSHRTELDRTWQGPKPLHPRNHELVAIPRFGRVDALDCDDLWPPPEVGHFFGGNWEVLYNPLDPYMFLVHIELFGSTWKHIFITLSQERYFVSIPGYQCESPISSCTGEYAKLAKWKMERSTNGTGGTLRMNYLNSMSLLAISTGLLGFVHQQYDDGNLTSELPRRAFKTTRLSDGLPIHHLRVELRGVSQWRFVHPRGKLFQWFSLQPTNFLQFFWSFHHWYPSNTDICKPSLVQQSFNITNFKDWYRKKNLEPKPLIPSATSSAWVVQCHKRPTRSTCLSREKMWLWRAQNLRCKNGTMDLVMCGLLIIQFPLSFVGVRDEGLAQQSHQKCHRFTGVDRFESYLYRE